MNSILIESIQYLIIKELECNASYFIFISYSIEQRLNMFIVWMPLDIYLHIYIRAFCFLFLCTTISDRMIYICQLLKRKNESKNRDFIFKKNLFSCSKNSKRG
jgi:hypothetical protein